MAREDRELKGEWGWRYEVSRFVRRQQPEAAIQRAVFEHLRIRPAAGVFSFHCPNGGARRPIEAAILKGLGVVAGVPDVIAIKDGRTFALELKTPGGRLSDNQRATHRAMLEAGVQVAVADNLDDALALLEGWELLRRRWREQKAVAAVKRVVPAAGCSSHAVDPSDLHDRKSRLPRASLPAHKLIARIEIELAHHLGYDNGRLQVTAAQFIEYGPSRGAIASSIREAEALGFIKVSECGEFALTYCGQRGMYPEPPSHNWRNIKTTKAAERIAAKARSAKAVRRRRRSADEPVAKPSPPR